MIPLLRLFYVSSASPGLGEHDVAEILSTSRRKNVRNDLTGCLLFTGQHFAQVLEGPEAITNLVASRIADDSRHSSVRVLQREMVSRRLYSSWAMGFVYHLDVADDIASLTGAREADTAYIAKVMAEMQPDTIMGALI